jgi:DNA repair protein RadC
MRQSTKSPPKKNRFAAIRAETLNEKEQTAVVALALEVLESRQALRSPMENPTVVRNYLRLQLSDRRTETFGVLFLDNRHRTLHTEELFHGTLDGCSVFPRVVVQRALEVNAAAVVFYHNHPSGSPEPSRADEALTRRLRDALATVDIRVLDHIVVGAQGDVSFAERGLL